MVLVTLTGPCERVWEDRRLVHCTRKYLVALHHSLIVMLPAACAGGCCDLGLRGHLGGGRVCMHRTDDGHLYARGLLGKHCPTNSGGKDGEGGAGICAALPWRCGVWGLCCCGEHRAVSKLALHGGAEVATVTVSRIYYR